MVVAVAVCPKASEIAAMDILLSSLSLVANEALFRFKIGHGWEASIFSLLRSSNVEPNNGKPLLA
jgi:hypothetical protein